MTRGPLEINLHEILRARAGKMVPGFLISALEKLIRQDQLNAMLRHAYPAQGSAFARRILDYLNIRLEVEGLDALPSERLMFAGNHPLGGLDGIALIAVLGERYGDDGVRFLVNDLLMNIEPLRRMFLPVNKFGRQGREGASAIRNALHSDMQIFQFPAGLVSRLQPGGDVRDLEWRKAFVTMALESGRGIVPVRFLAVNRKRFYRLARLRKQLHIPVNLEQALLPGELVAAHDCTFRIIFGTPVRPRALIDSGMTPARIAARIRDTVYTL